MATIAHSDVEGSVPLFSRRQEMSSQMLESCPIEEITPGSVGRGRHGDYDSFRFQMSDQKMPGGGYMYVPLHY